LHSAGYRWYTDRLTYLNEHSSEYANTHFHANPDIHAYPPNRNPYPHLHRFTYLNEHSDQHVHFYSNEYVNTHFHTNPDFHTYPPNRSPYPHLHCFSYINT